MSERRGIGQKAEHVLSISAFCPPFRAALSGCAVPHELPAVGCTLDSLGEWL